MNEEIDPITKRLTDARFAAINCAFEQSILEYKQLLTADPLNKDLYFETLLVERLYMEHAQTRTLCATAIAEGRRELERLLSGYRYPRIEQHGRKVFSQADEDGLLEEVFGRIGEGSRTFIEVGVQSGIECNTHYLLHKGWRGGWVDGDTEMVKEARKIFDYAIPDQLAVTEAWATVATFNDMISSFGFPEEIDLLSIDIDGMDYWMWRELATAAANPRVVIIEYNARFLPPLRHVVPYDENWQWDGTDYYGASLQSLTDLATVKGYQLVGCSMNGGNAIFVRNDLTAGKFAYSGNAALLYQPARYELYRMGAFDRGHPAKAGPWLDI